MRRQTLRLVLIGTLIFALLLALGLGAVKAAPVWRERRLESALEAGDTRAARRLADKIADAERRSDYLERCDYLDAAALMAERDWEGASALLTALGDYEDAPGLLAECRYGSALEQMERGETAKAAEAFRELGAYRDAAELYTECRYREALSLCEQGETAEALSIFAALGEYRDAKERTAELAMELTGLRDTESALAQLSGLSPDELALRQELAQARDALPVGCLAAGFFHTLGRCDDGRVLACGDDSFGQCRTEDWTGITAVAAGAYHSLGLRDDGTVAAVGRNAEGQCEVSTWSRVIAIAAGDYASYGLRDDGMLLFTGMGNYSSAQSWTGVTAISAGSYELGALFSDGAARLAPDAIGTEGLTELVALAVNTGCAVGVRGDGSLISGQLELPDWREILTVSLSGTRLLALDRTGHVRCLSFRPSDALELSDLENVVAVADGGTHVAVAFADGSVRVFGQTEQGQGETADWRLFG